MVQTRSPSTRGQLDRVVVCVYRSPGFSSLGGARWSSHLPSPVLRAQSNSLGGPAEMVQLELSAVTAFASPALVSVNQQRGTVPR